MEPAFTVRPAVPGDLAAVDLLLARSYPRLLKADYPPSVLVTALPLISRARPELVGSGRYFVAVDKGDGRLIGAGGYSLGPPQARVGHIRHLASDPDRLRQGVARAVLQRVLTEAAAEGVAAFDCLSTRTAVRFYAAMGFAVVGPVTVALAPGIDFPAIRMQRGA